MKLLFSRVTSPFGEVENVEVRKRKYRNGSTKTKVRNGITEVKRLVPRLFLCGWGTPPIQERSGKPVRV